MPNILTHGSLFAGIGGFELAAKEAGIKTLWSCEIEPYPRLVIKSRFPDVTQYGDIHKLSGKEAEPVDILTWGSPCQSFSQAGSRSGLDGASGLFYEAVRVAKEMFIATNGEYPKYCVMENVLGIYSSKSQGKSDFREVLNEIIHIKDSSVNVPEPKDGKFLTAGAIVGDGYSLAWVTKCASRFGVAQRRRRMFLVFCPSSERAAEILSEPEGEGRHFTPSYFAGQGSAGGAEVGAGGVVAFEPGALARIDKSAWEDQVRTLRADMGDNQAAVAYAAPLDLRNAVRNGGNQGMGVGDDGEPSFTLTAQYTHGVAQVQQHIVENHANDSRYKLCADGVAPNLNARMGLGGGNVDLCVEVKPIVLDERKQCAPITEDVVPAMTATQYKGSAVYFEPATTYNICSDASNAMRSANAESGIYETDTTRTLDTGGGSPTRNQGGTIIAIQGNVLNRKDENGPAGIGFREDVGYTLNTVDKGGAVAYQETVGALCASDYRGIRNQDIGEDKAVVETSRQTVCFGNNGYGKWNTEPATLKANGGDFPGAENLAVENKYAVRRLTPLECLRLQGYPDYWLNNLHILHPIDEQLASWRSAWAELGKTKSDNALRKWLAEPYSDSNAYKAIGNSLAVPCAIWVMRGIVESAQNLGT
ncbi:hypothetical protein FACS1894217_08930 [Clostridia bacterium]|nr:hypothetical protein FACS1894217_08930 [Clostridia bacterium]